MGNYDAIVERLKNYAMRIDEVTTVLIIGSQARKETPADEYSDLDVIMVVKDPAKFLYEDKWLESLGRHSISFVENTIGGEKERRLLFEDGLDVDFVIISQEAAGTALLDADGLQILQRGYTVLIDKSGLTGQVKSALLTPPLPPEIPPEHEYLNVVNDFWYHTIWTVKKLLRGELWAAKLCVDGYMKYKLLWLLEFHAHIENGWNYDTWHSGRFIDLWADAKAMEEMQFAFARYEKDDISHALTQTMDIFSRIALEISEKTEYPYPEEAETVSRGWIRKALASS